jgi:hypothetical protein
VWNKPLKELEKGLVGAWKTPQFDGVFKVALLRGEMGKKKRRSVRNAAK